MFNFYLNEKKSKNKSPIETPEELYQRNKSIEDMIKRYRNRINNEVLSLASTANDTLSRSPSPFSNLQDTYKSRTRYSSKPVQDQTSPKPTTSPKHAFTLRPRDKYKEIQPNLKFKLIGTERLKEALKTQRAILSTSECPISKTSLPQNSQILTNTSQKSPGRVIYGYYHYKLPIKTIESLALDLHSTTRNVSKSELSKKYKLECLGFRDRNSKTPIDTITREDLVPICSDVLGKYGVWKGKRHIKTPKCI